MIINCIDVNLRLASGHSPLSKKLWIQIRQFLRYLLRRHPLSRLANSEQILRHRDLMHSYFFLILQLMYLHKLNISGRDIYQCTLRTGLCSLIEDAACIFHQTATGGIPEYFLFPTRFSDYYLIDFFYFTVDRKVFFFYQKKISFFFFITFQLYKR